MRFLFFITIFFAFVSNANSQLPTKLKYDELIYSFDSSTVLIRKGSVSSVYNIEKSQYAVAPVKNEIINFPNTNNYAEINSKTGELSIYRILPDGTTTVRGNSWSAYIGFGTPYYGHHLQIDLNGKLFNVSTNEYSEEKIIRPWNWAQCAIEKVDEGIYIINSYQEVDFYRNQIDEWMMVDGFNCSGVFDFNQKKWIIEPIYRECKVINGNVICSKSQMIKPYEVVDDIPIKPEFYYLFDIFNFNKKIAEKIYSDVAALNKDLVAKILDVDKARKCDDNIHWVTIRDNKEGFVRFQLFDEESDQKPHFVYQEILKHQADFIYYSEYQDMLGLVYLDSVNKVVLYKRSPEKIDEFILVDTNSSSVNYTPDPAYDVRTNFRIDLFGDSILVVNDFVPEVMSQIPLMSILWLGEDSIDGDTFVYFAEQPAFDKSGVYDLNLGKWLIDPDYKSVIVSSKGYLVETGVYNAQGLNTDSEFSIFDQHGELLHAGIYFEELVKNPAYFIYLINSDYKIDSVFEAQVGADQHRKNQERLKYYYVRIGNELSLYCPTTWWNNYNSNLMCEPKEFVHANTDIGFRFWLEGDSIYIATDSLQKSVSKKSGKIICSKTEYNYPGEVYEGGFEITLIEGIDTVVFGPGSNGNDYNYYNPTYASIEMENGLLIVNDRSVTQTTCMECMDENGGIYVRETIIESENSAVWKFVNRKWERFSPYYASIVAIPGGYIASSGYFEDRYTDYGWMVQNELDKISVGTLPSRYFFLDSNLNVVPYMDWFDFPLIEDLGFGLKVCYDNSGCFFMTYNRVAVTNAEWDDFELFGKKLKAIKNEVPMIDEYGEQVYEENGVPVMASESVIMFFKIP